MDIMNISYLTGFSDCQSWFLHVECVTDSKVGYGGFKIFGQITGFSIPCTSGNGIRNSLLISLVDLVKTIRVI